MMSDVDSATCVVCGKVVAVADRNEHLAANHLGPHYFWYNTKKFRTMEPSMRVRDLKKLVDAPPPSWLYRFIQDRNGGQAGPPDNVEWSDDVAVDLTREPHFFSVPPATMWRDV
jgi:hypothetical protein